MPVWDTSASGGASVQFQAAHFAIFRLLGYNITDGWLLLEFLGLDTSCGQLPVAPTSVAIAGPMAGEPATSYSFTATVSPSTTTTPVTYTWEITDHDTITNTGGISNTIMVDWSGGGSKAVMVTAVNSTGLSVSQSHTINIAGRKLYLPFINKN